MSGLELRIDEAEKRSLEDVLEALETTPQGLSEKEAGRRLERHGPNALEEERQHPLLKFISYFWGPIPWMIEAAAVLSALVGRWADLAIILTLLMSNAVIGFWQEHKASDAIAALKRKIAARARVRRGGTWREVEARELVPGDALRLRLGDIVPADVKIADGDLDIDQSVLTGESLPVDKHAGDIAYSGTVIQRGEADAYVVATGMNTYFGKTAQLVEEARTRSHYQDAVMKIGRVLIVAALVLVAVIIAVSVARSESLLDTLELALVLTVASIPVAMPAVLSVTMAVGATKLAKRQAIVSRLVSIEEMAGMDVLCSDKTGTLTQNRLVLGDPVPVGDTTPAELIRYGALASRREDGDPIETPIFAALEQHGDSLDGFEVDDFSPFDPVRKRTEASVIHDGSRLRVSKGAPQVVLELSEVDTASSEQVQADIAELAGRGYRALGVARTDADGQWRFLGLLALYDPPREDSADTIRAAERTGVKVKMLTGDHLEIARETARQLGLDDHIVAASDLFGKGGEADAASIEAAGGFSQVFPEHKFKIVAALQQRGHIVGMTGDGVNDAPALKKADVGVAVAGATDAARSAADLVLTAPGLSVIIDAIGESRRIFERMLAYATYRIAETVRILLLITAAVLIFGFFPVTAAMIIILALLNDLPILMIAYDNARVSPKPKRWDMSRVNVIAGILGLAGVVSTFGLFVIGDTVLNLPRSELQTLIFLKLAVAGHLTIYLTRTQERPFWSRPYPALSFIGVTETTQVFATIFAAIGIFMTPIGWELALFTWGYALAWWLINDRLKVYGYRAIARWRAWEVEHEPA